jgi:hypothetical protein
MSETMRNIDAELKVLYKVNWSIGVNPTLTDEEREGLRILGRVREYLEMRRSYGEELFEREKYTAGKSTKNYDMEVK